MSKGSKRKYYKTETVKPQEREKVETGTEDVKMKEQEKIETATEEEKDLFEDDFMKTSKNDKKSEKEQEDFFDEEDKENDEEMKNDDEAEKEIEEKDEESLNEEEKKGGETSDKMKTLISVLIIVGGLFAGSLFVDIAQLVTGKGISSQTLESTDIFSLNNKTWVSFEEPITKVSVLVDKDCEECDPSQALLFLRRYIPTMLASEVDVTSNEGKKLIEESKITALPAFVFDTSVAKTDFYLQAAQLFIPKEDKSSFSLDIAQLGVPVGKYLKLPEVGENDIVVGSGPVTIIEFSDFQCPYCQVLHTSMSKILKEYNGKVRLVYKHLPLDFHQQAQNAALASECANEQGKFLVYADYLFANQKDWGEIEGLAIFKRYAGTLKLNVADFNRCVDENQYTQKISSNMKEAQSFGINGTPGTFINDSFFNGAVEYEKLKATIEKELTSAGK
ncbi:MAG: DsbA family protein [Candidatus Moraniibacteriota bacterium]|nr:MAG: DsbA family protein [Candidatus Moranbacteria bacterium]